MRLGEGAGKLDAFFDTLNRQNIRPLAMTLDGAGVVAAPADLFAAVEAFEKTVQPAYGRNFTDFSKTRPIRWDLVVAPRGETLTPEQLEAGNKEQRRLIDAALPKQAYAKPKKARTLLVVESLHGMSHNTIPHANVMLQRLGETTGAWKTVFSNDLTNLYYPKIKKLRRHLPEQHRRRSVRGSGRARGPVAIRQGRRRPGRRAWHAVGLAQLAGIRRDDRREDAPHRLEQGVMHVYDAASPISKPITSKAINLRARSTTASTSRARSACAGTTCGCC